MEQKIIKRSNDLHAITDYRLPITDYRLLQTVREEDTWEEWVLYLLQLDAVEQTAGQTLATIHGIKAALFDYKHRIRDGYKFYSQDLINNLFAHPYTKIEFVQRDLQVSRISALNAVLLRTSQLYSRYLLQKE